MQALTVLVLSVSFNLTLAFKKTKKIFCEKMTVRKLWWHFFAEKVVVIFFRVGIIVYDFESFYLKESK